MRPGATTAAHPEAGPLPLDHSLASPSQVQAAALPLPFAPAAPQAVEELAQAKKHHHRHRHHHHNHQGGAGATGAQGRGGRGEAVNRDHM